LSKYLINLPKVLPESYLKYPQYFYKYIPFTKASYIEDILSGNLLYFSLPEEFHENDNYDCRCFNIVIESKLDRQQYINDEIKFDNPNLPQLQKNKYINPDKKYTDKSKILNRLIKDGFNSYRTGIMCVTDSQESIKMWKEYIPNGEGVCIKLDGWIIYEHLCSIPVSACEITQNFCLLRRVDYVSKPLRISYHDFVVKDPGEVGVALLYTKLKKKEFEQEYRFMIHECINQSIKFPAEIVKEVIAGPNNTDEQMKLINSWNNTRISHFSINKRNGY
jgi:hypothetical protein